MTTSQNVKASTDTNDCGSKSNWREAEHIQSFISAMAAGSINGLNCVLDQKLLTLLVDTIPCEKDLIVMASEFAEDGELADGYNLEGSCWSDVYSIHQDVMREGIKVLAKRDDYSSFLDYIKMGLEFYGISDYDGVTKKHVDIEALLERIDAKTDTEKEVYSFATYFMGVQLLVYVLEAYTSYTAKAVA